MIFVGLFNKKPLSEEEVQELIVKNNKEVSKIAEDIKFYDEKVSILTKNILSWNNTLGDNNREILLLKKNIPINNAKIVELYLANNELQGKVHTSSLELMGCHKKLNTLYIDEQKILSNLEDLNKQLKKFEDNYSKIQ